MQARRAAQRFSQKVHRGLQRAVYWCNNWTLLDCLCGNYVRGSAELDCRANAPAMIEEVRAYSCRVEKLKNAQEIKVGVSREMVALSIGMLRSK
jgi:hypothetical protein